DDGYGNLYISDYGNGMGNFGSSPTVVNCVFTDNYLSPDYVSNNGSGMYNNAGSNPTVSGCAFINNNNSGLLFGGGVYNENNQATFTDCSFQGSAMVNFYTVMTITNCTFRNNSARALSNYFCDAPGVSVTNCVFDSNEGGGMHNDVSTVSVTNCAFT